MKNIATIPNAKGIEQVNELYIDYTWLGSFILLILGVVWLLGKSKKICDIFESKMDAKIEPVEEKVDKLKEAFVEHQKEESKHLAKMSNDIAHIKGIIETWADTILKK